MSALDLRRARREEMDRVLELRRAVFCEEQGVPADLEHDEHDAAALHMVAIEGDRVLATCRMFREGDAVRLGRMAVAQERRGEGIGASLLDAAHELAEGSGADLIEIHAQTSALGFWERAGYVAEGECFEEAGLEHVRMRRPLATVRR